MKIFLGVIMTVLLVVTVRAQDNEEIEFKPIQDFIDAIESENMNYFKENVIYPLDRMYPLP